MSLDARALEVLEAALAHDGAAERSRCLDELCGGDAALKSRVEAMLALDCTDMGAFATEAFTARSPGFETIPQRIGIYRVTGVIGEGGMSIVLAGERDDGLFDQHVAIKLIARELDNPEARALFAQERQILGRLVHPAIARILGGGEQEGRPYLVMDRVDGQPVTEALDASGAGLDARLDAFVAICEAVAYAHRNMVIHADIKPSNVLMSAAEDGAPTQIKLLDFGIARLADDLATGEATERYPLTRAYAAPERLAGAPPTLAGDVYSLGVLLHEMLTGTAPIAGHRMSEAGENARVPQRRLRGDLDAIAACALAADPANRYADVAALLSDIRAYRHDHPVAARADEGWRYAAHKFVRRHRRGLAVTMIGGAGLLAATAISLGLYLSAEKARAEAAARFEDAHGTAHYLLFDLMDRLQRQPRALPLRVEVAGVAQHYLDRLSRAPNAGPQLRFEAASGLWRLASQQANPGHPSLGLIASADANLVRAGALASTVDLPQARTLRAHILIDQVELATEMKFDHRAANRLLAAADDAVRKAGAGDPALPAQLAYARAALLDWDGRYDEAIAAARAAARQVTGVGDRDAVLTRARLLDIEADATYYQGKPAAAEPLYAGEAATLLDGHRRWADDNFLLLQLARARWALATTALELHHVAPALAQLRQADSEAARALAFDPADSEARRNLRIIHTAYGQALSMAGRHAEALALLAAQARGDQAAARADPANVRLQRDYAYSLTVVAEALAAAHRSAQSCATDLQAQAIYSAIRKSGHMTRLDDDGNAKVARARMARTCR